MMKNYKYLIGKKISHIKEDETYIYFITDDNLSLRIEKFIPYCSCYVGEYIDDISIDGDCYGMITNIEKNIIGDQENYYDGIKEIVYKGNVTFYFENGKVNMSVHGEDNGYYGVAFTMPVEVINENKDN